jgi:hypothetical protein
VQRACQNGLGKGAWSEGLAMGYFFISLTALRYNPSTPEMSDLVGQ